MYLDCYNQLLNQKNFLETKNISLKKNSIFIQWYETLFTPGETWVISISPSSTLDP